MYLYKIDAHFGRFGEKSEFIQSFFATKLSFHAPNRTTEVVYPSIFSVQFIRRTPRRPITKHILFLVSNSKHGFVIVTGSEGLVLQPLTHLLGPNDND